VLIQLLALKRVILQEILTELQLMEEKIHFRHAPPSLTFDKTSERVTVSPDFVTLFKESQKEDFPHLLTGDESWLFFEDPHDEILVLRQRKFQGGFDKRSIPKRPYFD
jgi:hypothetical protein